MSTFSKKYLIKASECHLDISSAEEKILGLTCLDDFINNPNNLRIFAVVNEENGTKTLAFIEETNQNAGKIVVFCKNKAGVLEEDNVLALVQITSIFGSPTVAFYHTLNNVFKPLLTQENSTAIEKNIANLQADLRSIILSSNKADSVNSLEIIESLNNEVEYWEIMSRSAKNRLSRQNAESITQMLLLISKDFNVIEVLPLNEVEDLLENAHNTLDDIWRHESKPYSAERMRHVMDIIALDLKKVISKQLRACDVWDDNYNSVAEILNQCITIGKRWLESCQQLTEIFWPNYASNMWKEVPYQPVELSKLVERLEEILKVQTLLRQLTSLLTPQEQEDLKTNAMFQPFKSLDLMEFGQYSSNQWLKACKEFEYLLQPAEEKVGLRLKKQFGSVDVNTRQLLHEFTRYSELINRPIVKQMLLSERQHLLNLLYDYVRLLQSQSTDHKPGVKFDTPQIIAEIMVLKQLEAKLVEVLSTSEKLLKDLNGYNSLQEMATEILNDLKQQHTELYESWTRDVLLLIKKNILSLKELEPVVQFSKNKFMTVNFSSRLVTLISEVRQFRALGYHIMSEIEETTEHAKKFVKLARILEQIANFHNTVGDRMITCQRPMMLSSALELSRLVQEEKVVSWADTKSVEKYVEVLRIAVEKLSKENNLLASFYYQISEKIQVLDDVDLIKEYSKWKDITRQMRQIMTQVEEKGFQNLHSWKLDTDQRLCAVLEKQYICSLNTLHLYLPEIYTDIVYRKSQLEFSPEQHILMEKYEQQLRKFLDIPKTFRGVCDSSDLFVSIVDKNTANLEKVSRNTAELSDQLKSVLKHWQSWLQLEVLDTSKLSVWQHWDMHFRASKTFGQEIAKLPSTEERVGCFLIGLSRLRSDLEAHNRSYWDQLVLSLKDHIAEHVVKLQNFVDPATAALTKQPVSVEEVGSAGAIHANITKQAPEMEEDYNQLLQKTQILSSWTREQVDSVNRLKGAWSRLQNLLENHQHIIAKQMETVKTSLNIEYENLEREIDRFSAKWEQTKPKAYMGQIMDQTIEELQKQLNGMKEKKTLWQEILTKKEKLGTDYEKFSLELPDFAAVDEVAEDMKKEDRFWDVFEEFYNELEVLSNEEWIVFRKKMYRFEDFLLNWQTKLKNSQQTSDLVTRILQEVNKYEEIMQSLKYVRGEDFNEKHWMDVFNLLQIPMKSIDTLIFKDFLNASDQLKTCQKQLQAICKKAASEIVVRQALAELDQWDVQDRFLLTPHENSRKKTTMLVKEFKEILNKIGDNQSLLQSLKNSADYENFLERVTFWENKLATLDQNLTSLSQVQRKWVYLEPIFGSGTLSQEKSRFDKIDKDLHLILRYIEKDNRVSSLFRYPNLTTILKTLQEQLGRCQKSLDYFLQEKREKFPRFLFLGDDDLLEVVGQSSKEHVIQAHLKKLFAGINKILLDANGQNITAMVSLQGEVVVLGNPVYINKPVEEWLNALVKEMQSTLKQLLVECLADGQNTDPLKYPSQVLCLADSITFTLKAEQAVSNMTLPQLLAYYKAQMTHYSSLELSVGEESLTLEEEASTLELKLKALLLDTVHHIDIINDLLDENITTINDWTWKKQLRFYSNSSGEVTVKMANSRMEYGYEYLGNAPKLVRTPLTDRAFLTLTQGMHLGMGGNPYGPAGTGKTESVKALGGFLGRQVLVFNCDEGIDASAMGRILSGLVRSGAWGCFDEFNRLDEATLSAVSMQIEPIQAALRTKHTKVRLLEQDIEINNHCGVFVTLNPAGGSYGGRNKLPDNLKQLFRPVVMTHPDHEQIARTLLLCEGYQNAEIIGRKLVEVFDSAGKLLSRQQHYDWGLRAIRTVLLGCARALKQHRKNTEEAEGNQLLTELTLVVNVLCMDTLSKLTFADSLKFNALIKSVFSDVLVESGENSVLAKALEESCVELKIVHSERQVAKCLELYEQLKQRMGVAIVGPPSSGKSTIRNLLFHALNKTGLVLKKHVFNPKSMSKTDLLGQIDLDTRQWNDGVLTLYSLQVTSESENIWSWIVCDGNIDPDWIESLNSVLDDNRLFSLPSGWRIQFGPNVNFLFETHDLTYASPATISRMGIVLLSAKDLDLELYVQNYLTKVEEPELLFSYIKDYFFKSLEWICNEGELSIPSSKVAITRTGLTQLVDVKTKSEFAVALINGLGQQLQEDFRELFAQGVYESMDEIPPPVVLKSRYNKDRDVIDIYYTHPQVEIHLCNTLPLVLTGDVQKTFDVLRVWLCSGHEENFLLIGPHGAAKSLVLDYLVKERSDMELVTIHCTANLAPYYIINKLAQHCIAVSTNKGKLYKPRKGNLMLHFKNLHLLKADKWGTNIIVEFLHQVVTYNAFFDANLELVSLENVTIVGTLSSVGSLSTRFTSIFCNYSVSWPDQEDLSIITISYLTALMKELGGWTKAKIVKLATTVISTFEKIRSSFQVVSYKHYNFTPHDLITWCASLTRYKTSIEQDSDATILQVVFHEALKIFGDKLVSVADYEKLLSILTDTFKHQWGPQNLMLQNEFYVAVSPTSSALQKLSEADWTGLVQRGTLQFEREGQQLDVLITKDLLQFCADVSRVLSFPGGNLVLVGRAGVGRKSAVKIVSALQAAHLMSINNTNLDLKAAVQLAGIQDEDVYLLLEDHIFKDRQLLSAINILISSGEVPGLYNTTELDSITAGLKDEASRDNFEGSLTDFFNERVKQKLHVVACIDVDNLDIWTIFEYCPAFLHESVIIWRTEWSTEVINTILMAFIDRVPDVEFTPNIPKIFDLIKEKSPAPSRYIAMIKLYIEIYAEKKKNILSKQQKLDAGVSKLTEAGELVSKLKQDAVEQQTKLAEKQAKANSALDMISATMQNANTHKEEMEVLKQKTESKNKTLMVRKREIEVELAEVEPLIQEARAAVGSIKSESLSEIRSLRAPPEIIRDILEGVLRLMGIQDTSWNSMKTFLAKRGVKEEIRSFDASRITGENRQMVEKLMVTKSDSFDPKAAKRASVAAAPLAAWVAANVKYSVVLNKIKPLEREQNKLEQNLTDAENKLGELSVGLTDVDATVAKLKLQLAAYTKEAAEIEINLSKAQETLGAAEGLVSKLNEEFWRWQQQAKELAAQLEKLPDFCSLAAAFITYLSNESEESRSVIFELWTTEVAVSNFNFVEFMSTERERMQWQSEGLSSDSLSLENAIILLNTKITPLLTDPTSNAINWFKAHFKTAQMEVTSQNSPKFKTNLELGIRFGKILIIEEIETVPACLLPVLRREFTHQNERKLVQINGKLLDYHPDFVLILSSRNEHLKIPAEVTSIITTMNFTVTHAGLTEQLLSCTIRQENPKLEDRRKILLKEREELQEKQYKLQDQLLEDLATSSGNVLQNANLLHSLNETKASSTAIVQALEESSSIQEKLHSEYEVYKPLSVFGSYLYFACSEFAAFNVLYALSVQAFTKLFLSSLETFQGLESTTDSQKRHLFSTVYMYVTRGVIKSDRLTFGLHLIQKLFGIPSNEWRLFLGNAIPSRGDSENLPQWVPKSSSNSLQNIHGVIPELYKKLHLEDQKYWSKFMGSEECEKDVPQTLQLTEFENILVVQALRPDRSHSVMTQTVLNMTGLRSIDPPVVELAQIVKESTHLEPILVITASGSDPSGEILALAPESREVAMGEGQENEALTALKQTAEAGKWLILKNLHLVTEWLAILCQELQNLKPHDKFRVWLITEQNPQFNFVLAQNSLKIVYEAPQGVRNNLLRSFHTFGGKYFEKLQANSGKIFFILCCIHAILQERRTYIPQGWSKWYEFSDTDLGTYVKLVEDLWQMTSPQTPWKFISGLCSEAVYGGRIENLDDLKILKSYLGQYLNDEVLSHRWAPFNSRLTVPSQAKFQDYLALLKQLPDKDSPSYFGLPENIARAWERQTSAEIITKLKTKNEISRNFDRDVWQKNLTPFIALWRKLNQGQDFVRMAVPNFALKESAIESFLEEEFSNSIAFIQRIHKDFTTLNKICRGSLIPEDSDVVIGNSLMRYQVPQTWGLLWEGPKDPSLYLRSLMSKTINLAKWREKKLEGILQNAVNLGDMLRPSAFLTSYKQEHSRLTKITMDQLEFESQWTPPNQKYYIILTDLLIEGGLFDGSNLKPCHVNSENLNNVPNCYVTCKETKLMVKQDKYIDVPLYNNSSREKQLTNLQILTTGKDKQRWVQAGLAFYVEY